MSRISRFSILFFVCLAGSSLKAELVSEAVSYPSTIGSDSGASLNLCMEVNYRSGFRRAPIAVVMHQYSAMRGNFDAYRPHAQRLTQQGFFALTIAMRGRDGSEGTRDSGGLEVHDIYDAIEYVKANYRDFVDPQTVYITGYSGGGGNVLSAVTKMPDYFRAASSFFGMSDYGFDLEDGWYNNGAKRNHQKLLARDIGDPNREDSRTQDRYMARASYLGAGNCGTTEVHLFVNEDETLVPMINMVKFQKQAQSKSKGDHVKLHIGKRNTYHDFNGNGINEPDEYQYWPHQKPTAQQQAAAEQWFLLRLLKGEIPQPMLADEGSLFVGGFLKTRRFEVWLGSGEDAAGELHYQIRPDSWSFRLIVNSSNADVFGTLTINLEELKGQRISFFKEGKLVEHFVAHGPYKVEGILNDKSLEFRFPSSSQKSAPTPLLSSSR